MYDNLCSRSSLQPKLSRRRYDQSYALQNISVFSHAQNYVVIGNTFNI